MYRFSTENHFEAVRIRTYCDIFTIHLFFKTPEKKTSLAEVITSLQYSQMVKSFEVSLFLEPHCAVKGPSVYMLIAELCKAVDCCCKNPVALTGL